MGLHQICAQIERNSKLKASSILSEAKQEVQRIEDLAKKRASETITNASNQALSFCELEQKERLNASQIEASKIISDAKSEAVKRAVDEVWEVYSQSSKKSGYKQKLKQWAQLALDELSVSGAILRANSSDSSTLSSLGFKVGDSIDCCGGLIAQSKDGRIMVDYTLEAQFESKKEEVSKLVYSTLFSNEDYVADDDSLDSSAKTTKKSKGRQ